ncbi:MAG: hypothetical protein ACLQPD_01500 [Desulfomonilaceae bacterium]
MAGTIEPKKPFLLMSNDELLVWAAEALAEKAIGPTGPVILDTLLEQTKGRAGTLGDLIMQQLRQMKDILGAVIEEHDLKIGGENMDALAWELSDYFTTHAEDRLFQASGSSYSLIEHLIGLGMRAYKTFLLAAGLHILVYDQRRKMYLASALPDKAAKAASEVENLKKSIDQFLAHSKKMIAEWWAYFLGPLRGIHAYDRGSDRGMEWGWYYDIDTRVAAERLSCLGVEAATVDEHFSGARPDFPLGWLRTRSFGTNKHNTPDLEDALVHQADEAHKADAEWLVHFFRESTRFAEIEQGWRNSEAALR